MLSDGYDARKNAIGGRLLTPLGGMVYAPVPERAAIAPRLPSIRADADKALRSLSTAFDVFGISDGAVISFHHHYRNGDRLMNAVVDEAARRGLRGLTLAPSSLFPVHAPLVGHIQSGVIAQIITDYAKGTVADAMISGALRTPPLLQSHGGRARALETGQLVVDVAFVGASLARRDGACTGRGGTAPCGPLGYAMVDARFAKSTIVCAHEIADSHMPHIDIPAEYVDGILPFPHPGDTSGIASDTTLAATTPQAQKIGAMVAQVIKATGMMRNGMSLQTGAGGFSLAAVPFIGDAMARSDIRGSFISGGITGAHVALQAAGLFAQIRDVQCFDAQAVASSIRNPAHQSMSAAEYASPLHPAAAVDALSVMVLGAIEVDRNFNVNVTIGGDGRLMGGPGGHPDAAQGAHLTIVTTGLTAGGYPKIVDEVCCITTPGEAIDVVVTDHGIAVHPARTDLVKALAQAGLPVVSFETLRRQSLAEAHRTPDQRAVAPRLVLEHRAGGVLDWA